MDRTTKALLALIAVALWGLLLKPLISLPAAQAAPMASAGGIPAIACDANGTNVFVAQGTNVYALRTSPEWSVVKKFTLK